MNSNKLIIKIVLLSFIVISLAYCTANKITNNDLKIYNNIDLSLVNENNWEVSNDILYYINQHRIKIKKKILTKDTLHATACAVMHTKYMIEEVRVCHDYFFSRSDALKKIGATRVSENVAYGYTSAESVVNAWLKSEAHRIVIEGDYSNIGFGVLKSPNNNYYYTTLFFK
ncbi:CAP domain-containing protein [Thalassobellus citreus]|uniref:CAP domain-containing protein n=1 Tax=Thalassobellus citreus TaxID=3367752 RepID=UPI0037B315BE